MSLPFSLSFSAQFVLVLVLIIAPFSCTLLSAARAEPLWSRYRGLLRLSRSLPSPPCWACSGQHHHFRSSYSGSASLRKSTRVTGPERPGQENEELMTQHLSRDGTRVGFEKGRRPSPRDEDTCERSMSESESYKHAVFLYTCEGA
jgi:hypothetical protein